MVSLYSDPALSLESRIHSGKAKSDETTFVEKRFSRRRRRGDVGNCRIRRTREEGHSRVVRRSNSDIITLIDRHGCR